MLYPNKPKNQVFSKYIQKRDLGAIDTAYVRQNISVSVDLPQYHSNSMLSNDSSFYNSLNSPSTPYLDDDLFEGLGDELNVSPAANSELVDTGPGSNQTSFSEGMYSVTELEPSLADLDLDSLINTAQNNLNSISGARQEGGDHVMPLYGHTPQEGPGDQEQLNSFFRGTWNGGQLW